MRNIVRKPTASGLRAQPALALLLASVLGLSALGLNARAALAEAVGNSGDIGGDIGGDFGGDFSGDLGGTAGLCQRQIAMAEGARGIPRGLLASIAMVESGRWHAARRQALAWPWTVTARGVGNFYRTKAEATAAVRRIKAAGVRNIDVGCMQVNLLHHPAAFANLDDALDPAKNVAYGADFLVRLRAARGSWRKAVAHYHSATPSQYRPYAAKVFRAWADARRRLAGERSGQRATAETASRAAIRAEQKAKREAWKANLRDRRTRFAAWIAGRLASKTKDNSPNKPSGRPPGEPASVADRS